MTCWQILEIEPTRDLSVIKKAYAKELKLHHPEEDYVAFQAVREAYTAATNYAKNYNQGTNHFNPSVAFEFQSSSKDISNIDYSSSDKSNENIVIKHQLTIEEEMKAFMGSVASLYAGFFRRIEISNWVSLLNSHLVWNLQTHEVIHDQIMEFLKNHCHFPKSIWHLFSTVFNWAEKKEYLYARYPKYLINYIFWILDRTEMLRYCYFEKHQKINFEAYLEYRENAYISLKEQELSQAKEYIHLAEKMMPRDPDLLCIIAEYHFRNKKRSTAKDYFDEAHTLYPHDLHILFIQVVIYLRAKKLGKAIKAVREVLPSLGQRELTESDEYTLELVRYELDKRFRDHSNNLMFQSTMKQIHQIQNVRALSRN